MTYSVDFRKKVLFDQKRRKTHMPSNYQRTRLRDNKARLVNVEKHQRVRFLDDVLAA